MCGLSTATIMEGSAAGLENLKAHPLYFALQQSNTLEIAMLRPCFRFVWRFKPSQDDGVANDFSCDMPMLPPSWTLPSRARRAVPERLPHVIVVRSYNPCMVALRSHKDKKPACPWKKRWGCRVCWRRCLYKLYKSECKSNGAPIWADARTMSLAHGEEEGLSTFCSPVIGRSQPARTWVRGHWGHSNEVRAGLYVYCAQSSVKYTCIP